MLLWYWYMLFSFMGLVGRYCYYRRIKGTWIYQLTPWAYCEIPGHIGARTEEGRRRGERKLFSWLPVNDQCARWCRLWISEGRPELDPQVLLAWEKRFNWIQWGVNVIFTLNKQSEVKRTQSETFNLRPSVTVKGVGGGITDQFGSITITVFKFNHLFKLKTARNFNFNNLYKYNYTYC